VDAPVEVGVLALNHEQDYPEEDQQHVEDGTDLHLTRVVHERTQPDEVAHFKVVLVRRELGFLDQAFARQLL